MKIDIPMPIALDEPDLDSPDVGFYIPLLKTYRDWQDAMLIQFMHEHGAFRDMDDANRFVEELSSSGLSAEICLDAVRIYRKISEKYGALACEDMGFSDIHHDISFPRNILWIEVCEAASLVALTDAELDWVVEQVGTDTVIYQNNPTKAASFIISTRGSTDHPENLDNASESR